MKLNDRRVVHESHSWRDYLAKFAGMDPGYDNGGGYKDRRDYCVPGGNASIAHLLARKLIAAAGK